MIKIPHNSRPSPIRYSILETRNFPTLNPKPCTLYPPPAFSLIELLVVIAIIALLAGITVPAVKAMSKGTGAAQAANQIRAYLSNARSLAIAQHRQVGVVFFFESPTHSLPARADVTAMQIFIEEFDQSTTPPKNPKNTLFKQYSTARDYLPAGIAVAALNDALNKGVITSESSGGHNIAILFDPAGQMITRHGLARRNFVAPNTPGVYPYPIADWNFASQGTTSTDNSSDGISSPGIFLFNRTDFAAQNIPAGPTGDAARNTWLKNNATVILVNANTGALLP